MKSHSPLSHSLKIVDYSSDDDAEELPDRHWLPVPHSPPKELPDRHSLPDRQSHVLRSMGFSDDSIQSAVSVCGSDANEHALIDFILALEHAQPEEAPVINVAPNIHIPNGICSDSDIELELDAEEEVTDDDGDQRTLLNMGFSSEHISQARESCGSGATTETLITFLIQHTSDYQNEEKTVLSVLKGYGYSEDVALRAIENCGPEDIAVLVDFMDAHSNLEEDHYEPEGYSEVEASSSRARSRKKFRVEFTGFEDKLQKSATMRGFGLPGEPVIPRSLTPDQARKPYFYFENVRSMPKGSWDLISGLLYNIKPEYVCAKHFSVSRRQRGYIHNLPLENRTPLLPIPPKTIREFLPNMVRFAPAWDTRQQLHCIATTGSTASICRRIQELMRSGEQLRESEKQEIFFLVKKWNLVWTGPGTCSSLEAHEIERALGFEENHTRGAIAMNRRYKSLGNAFQVDVVGFHLSALKPIFRDDGIRVLSLFSGIGGAEVALHRLGIPLKFVVSVESDPVNRKILENWWHTSHQTGRHRILEDVQDLNRAKVVELMRDAGGSFDLVIGGSPCNNFSGNNRSTRTGLSGEHSSLFYEFSRILNLIRCLQ